MREKKKIVNYRDKRKVGRCMFKFLKISQGSLDFFYINFSLLTNYVVFFS